MSIRVVVVDDQQLVREGFCTILGAQDDIEVVGEGADGEEAVRLAVEVAPDVVLMDIRMPNLDGIEATRRIVSGAPATRVLMLTTFDVDDNVYEALRAGASGFLLKNTTRDELVAAVRTVAQGESLLAPSVTRRVISAFVEQWAPGRASPPEALEDLTAREVEVLLQVARGLSNAEIAEVLILSEHTIKTHVAAVLRKLGVRDRVQAVVFAYETGLVKPSEP